MSDHTVAEDTRTRLLATALRLFSEHGVGATSLQMIADELGVTKAAVYYHFKTKDEITEAVAAPALQELIARMDEAERQRTRGAQIDHALSGFVDLIVRYRSLIALFNSDPGIMRAIDRSLDGVENFAARMRTLLAGPDPELDAALTVNVLLAGLALAGGAPEQAQLDDETLREHLFDIGRRMLGRPKRRARAGTRSSVADTRA
ncbi:TetR/AcrR family transcriptional regulator [Saccharomonospora azurea]|uniref:Transcriptional regulator n=1 Tax=Saccharomonospora azurea NA-128 TaxID=882081 RepID=H8GCP1_9PSEU|nr:TetR/AcrR family transcriptional regulator [Saccharomonospora azurea]EHK85076.1 transcriptional regulator [Saccharomonospora azurea SZMC 14600]EHY90814.1 transcriptional regulator [Saccharomonospora azurea NA-128]